MITSGLAIGMVELNSIARGIEICDGMVKAAEVIVGRLSSRPWPKAPSSRIPACVKPGTCPIIRFRPLLNMPPMASMAPSKPPSWKAVVSSPKAPEPNCTNSRRLGVSWSDRAICAPSRALWNRVTSPARLSSCVAAIAAAAPSLLSMAAATSSHRSAVVPSRALTEAKSVLLKIVLRISDRCFSVMPSMLAWRSEKMPCISRKFP